jgi:hypothetical protein
MDLFIINIFVKNFSNYQAKIKTFFITDLNGGKWGSQDITFRVMYSYFEKTV